MARIKKEDIRELSTDELTLRVTEEKMRYKKLKFNHTISPLENPRELRIVRRDIARLITEIKKSEPADGTARK